MGEGPGRQCHRPPVAPTLAPRRIRVCALAAVGSVPIKRGHAGARGQADQVCVVQEALAERKDARDIERDDAVARVPQVLFQVGESYVTIEVAGMEMHVQKSAVQTLLPNGTIKAL